MKIKVDAEGKKVIVSLIDAALKFGGINAFNNASMALSAMGVAEVPVELPKESPKEPPQGTTPRTA